jgi:hypothetical protein
VSFGNDSFFGNYTVRKNIENGFFPTIDNAVRAADNGEMGVNRTTGEDG